jgi:stage II sporulation protein D
VRRCWIGLCVLPSLWAAAPVTVKVKISQPPHVVEMPLERYVAAVVAAESGVFRSDEALKAMAVAARTYAIRMRGRHKDEGFDLCDTTHCQRASSKAIAARFDAAAAATAGEMLWYEGKPAFTPYSQQCGGRTEDARAVWPDMPEPYLKSHEDPWCAKDADWQWNGGVRQIAQALKDAGLRAPDRIDGIAIAGTTPSGRASTLVISGEGRESRVSASSFRFAIGREMGWNTVRSDAYGVRGGNGGFYFEGTGSGHGVGLCQTGSERMGESGKRYRDILAFYYPGTTLAVHGDGIQWQRLNGTAVSLLTVRPGGDRIVLDIAERSVRSLSAQTGWPVPGNIEILAYPDLDRFRDATGEPGWVAARSDGRRIHLQPVDLLQSKGLLESTLGHELLHILLEAQAAPGLPVWFREGMVHYLEKQPVTGTARIPADDDLRQRSDAPRARRAYADAEAMVASLVRAYGETVVVGWVKRGLPPDVMNASASQPQPNRR